MKRGVLNILIGGMIGSEGKGVIASYLGWYNHIDLAITNASPNAGHTFYLGEKSYVTRHLPISGILNKRSTIYLCAGSIIDPTILLEEIRSFNIDPDRICIHPRAAIISKKDILRETKSTVHIASTQKGVGSALINKIGRSASLAADHPDLQRYIRYIDVNWHLEQGLVALMEVPQGFDLSINSGLSYPYCTSREITVTQAMSDAQVHPSLLGKVYTVIRTFPIRVGNIVEEGVTKGYSGPFPDDSCELTWSDIGVPDEYTTNTDRVRRVCTFSFNRYKEMMGQIRPDYVFLNFANYLSKEKLTKLLGQLPEVTHLCFGPHIDDVELHIR